MPDNSTEMGARTIFLVFAVYILIQGEVYRRLAVKIPSHDCGLNFEEHPTKFAMQLIYFSHQGKCESLTIHIPNENVDVQLKFEGNKAQWISFREHAIFMSYAIISFVWMVTSIFALVAILFRPSETFATFIIALWLTSIIIGSIFDVFATVFHIYDITRTYNVDETFKYVGVVHNPKALNYFRDDGYSFVLPAVLFTLFSSRLVLIWLINVFGAICCLLLFQKMKSNFNENRSWNSGGRQNRGPGVIILSDRSKGIFFVDGNNQKQSFWDEINIFKKKNKPASQNFSAKNTNLETESSTIMAEEHPQGPNSQLNVERLEQSSSRLATALKSAISSVTKRFQLESQSHVSQELRGQFPWSYTNKMNDPVVLKSVEAPLESVDEELASTSAVSRREQETISPS